MEKKRMLGEAVWEVHGASRVDQDRDGRSLLRFAQRVIFFAFSGMTQTNAHRSERVQLLRQGNIISGSTESIYVTLGQTATPELYWCLLLAETGVGQVFSLRDSEVVQSFVADHPDVAEVLLEAKSHLVRCFGSNVRVSLRVLRDPEIGEEGELVAYIETPLSVDEAQSRLDDLDDGWFLDQVDRVGDFLNFNLAFV
jgi:hypothetical protein